MNTFKNILRLAIIESVNYNNQTVSIRMLDRVDRRTFDCPIPHPAAMNNSGFFVSPSVGTTVMVGFTYREAPVITAYIPNTSFAQDLTSSNNTKTFLTQDAEYPKLKPGELAVQGLLGSQLLFDKKGNICLEFSDSSIFYTNDNVVSTKVENSYKNTSSGRHIEGVIKRDLRNKARKVEEVFDKLKSPSYDKLLTEIGRNPNLSRTAVSISHRGAEFLRNPGLVENRELTYEFAIEDNVGSFQDEKNRVLSKDIFPLEELGRRDMSRADILNLNPLVYNNLLETVKGTVVDIYGNILDLNRNVLNYNGIDPKSGSRLEVEDKLLRRSIKYHFEINSKKLPTSDARFGQEGFEVDALDVFAEKIGYSHSRWSVDVDGEGLTKINIPSSTDTGNIPLLTRYSTSNVRRGDNSEAFRDPDNPTLDVLHLGFGENSGDGVSITETYAPANFGDRFTQQKINYRTAYHDIVTTANLLTDDTAVSNEISNALEGEADAGGRSVHMNLDGSLEMNIGKDNVDGKSLVQDFSGGMISRIGKDFNNNSIVSQLDGNVKMQIGGDSVESESKLDSPGVKFFVAHEDSFHTIEINSRGIFISSAADTNMVFDSSKNLVLKAKGELLLDGSNVWIHGTSDGYGETVIGSRLIVPTGKPVN